MKLMENIYFYPWESMNENNCNTIFIDGDLPILIDPGHEHLLRNLFEAMEEDGVSPGKVELVINTHGHADHCEGAGLFKEHGAMITISKEEDDFLRGEGGEFYKAMGMEAPLSESDFLLQEGELIIGTRRVDIYVTPGHTPASVCVYLKEEKVLIAGDLIFQAGVGRVDLPGGDPRVLKESINRMSELNIEYILPGHGQPIPGKDKVEANFEFLDQVILHTI